METFRFIPTPNPAELSFQVQVDAGQLRAYALPQVGTPYKLCPHVQGVNMGQGWDDYVFAEMTVYPPPPDEGFMWFTFVRSRTEEERKTPFRVYSKFRNHSWDDILIDVTVVEDPDFPRVTELTDGTKVNAPSNYLYPELIPGVDTGTRFEIREFLSEVPFKVPHYPTPIPTSVTLDIGGKGCHFSRVLTPGFDIPDSTNVLGTVADDGSTTSVSVVPGQKVPRTNFPTWQPYVLSAEPTYRDGLWHLIIVKVFPPALQKGRVYKDG